MLCAIVGINWGDEGKGRMVDLLSSDYDIVCRYQGGNNAGHTVVNERGKFILNLLPSGILRETTVNVMGNGMVVDIEHLAGETGGSSGGSQGLCRKPQDQRQGVVCMPYHKLLDILEEDRLADKKFGSTRRGIAPVYADKYMKKAIRMSDLLEPDTLYEKVRDIVEWKNLTVENGYKHEPISADAMYEWLKKFGDPILENITDVTEYLENAEKAGKNIMFEAQLGVLRDIDFGIYPYTSSSSTIAAYAPIGAGIPGSRLDKVVGIMKAYSSCVGEGPFTCELFGDEGGKLREAGGEYGAATGRPRRVGGFDVPASRYGIMMQGATDIALTKLDVLSYLDKIPVCTAYEIDGKITKRFPTDDRLVRAKPFYEYFECLNKDITGCRKASELPLNARKYIEYIEENTCCPIKYVSVERAGRITSSCNPKSERRP